ncbi:unnamed protein product, partial [marine sediment metagenome]
ARVVFDMIDQIPPYKIESIENGLRILFWPEEEKVIEEKVEIEIEDVTNKNFKPA